MNESILVVFKSICGETTFEFSCNNPNDLVNYFISLLPEENLKPVVHDGKNIAVLTGIAHNPNPIFVKVA